MKKIFFLLLIIFLIPVVYAGAYGAGRYGAGDYGVGEAAAAPSTSSETRTETTTTEDTGTFDPKTYLGFVTNFIAPGSVAELSKTNKITKTVTAIKGSLDSVVLFRLNSQTHTVMLDKVDEQTKTVSFILASEPQSFSLKENEKKQFDLDGDLLAETEISASNTNYSKLSTDVSISWAENQTVVIPTKKEEKLPTPKVISPPGTELKPSEEKKTETKVINSKGEEPKLKPNDFLPFEDILETIKKKYQKENLFVLELISGFAVFVLLTTFILHKKHHRKHKEEVI